MPYIFYQRLGAVQGFQAEGIFQRAVKTDMTTTALRTELQSAGLSYRWQDMLTDYRRAQSTMTARTYEGREKATNWFDKVLEPMRAEQGLTYRQALDTWQEMQRKVSELEVLSDKEMETWEIYESLW
jgi:hypothetical protein